MRSGFGCPLACCKQASGVCQIIYDFSYRFLVSWVGVHITHTVARSLKNPKAAMSTAAKPTVLTKQAVASLWSALIELLALGPVTDPFLWRHWQNGESSGGGGAAPAGGGGAAPKQRTPHEFSSLPPSILLQLSKVGGIPLPVLRQVNWTLNERIAGQHLPTDTDVNGLSRRVYLARSLLGLTAKLPVDEKTDVMKDLRERTWSYDVAHTTSAQIFTTIVESHRKEEYVFGVPGFWNDLADAMKRRLTNDVPKKYGLLVNYNDSFNSVVDPTGYTIKKAPCSTNVYWYQHKQGTAEVIVYRPSGAHTCIPLLRGDGYPIQWVAAPKFLEVIGQVITELLRFPTKDGSEDVAILCGVVTDRPRLAMC
jgi:hypothetical protein